jgi:hypothetical protein
MNLDDVADERSFCGYVASLLSEAARCDRTLEAYLCSLLSGVLRQRDTPPSYRLFAELLERALGEADVSYEDATLEHLTAISRGPDAYDNVVRRLIRQIVDLRQMRDAGILDLSGAELWWGQDAPSGRRWYNFTIEAYLEPTARLWENREVDPEGEVSWMDFDLVLADGQAYE